MAIKLLASRGIPFTYYDIEKNPDALQEFKATFPGAKTVPQIYDDQYFVGIGGYNELKEYLKNGK